MRCGRLHPSCSAKCTVSDLAPSQQYLTTLQICKVVLANPLCSHQDCKLLTVLRVPGGTLWKVSSLLFQVSLVQKHLLGQISTRQTAESCFVTNKNCVLLIKVKVHKLRHIRQFARSKYTQEQLSGAVDTKPHKLWKYVLWMKPYTAEQSSVKNMSSLMVFLWQCWF